MIKFENDPAYGALAYFYRGLSFREQGELDFAKECFEQGLEKFPGHYKCSRALSKILFFQKKYSKAYEIENMLCAKYPLSPERIPDLIRLSIASQKYEDIMNYTEVFNSLIEQPKSIKNSIAAGLAVSGKNLLKLGKEDLAVTMLLDSAKMSGGTAQVIKAVVDTLLGARKTEEVGHVLKKLASADIDPNVLNVLEFRLFCADQKAEVILVEGRKMLKSGPKDPDIYVEMINACIAGEKEKSIVEDLVFEAKKECSNFEAEFERLFSLYSGASNAKTA